MVLEWLAVPTVRAMARAQDERYADRLPGFALRLRAPRAAAELTQSQVAEKAGLSVTMVQNLERPSDARNPRLTALWALSEALAVDVAALVVE